MKNTLRLAGGRLSMLCPAEMQIPRRLRYILRSSGFKCFSTFFDLSIFGGSFLTNPYRPEMRTTVLFDTNAYRGLARDKSLTEIIEFVQKIKQKETAINIKPSAVRIVGMEMVNQLNEGQGGLNFEQCKAGLSALALHCYDEKSDSFHICPPPYANFALEAFNIKDESQELQLNSLAGMISLFRTNPSDAYEVVKQNGTLGHYAAHFTDTEAGFARDLHNLLENCKKVVKEDNPGPLTTQQYNQKMLKYIENDVAYTMLYGILFTIALKFGLQIDHSQMPQKVQYLKNTYPIASGFYSFILSKMFIGDIDIFNKKSRQTRWNWAWDYEVCCFISEKAVQTGRILLVTEEKDITRVLKKNNLGHCVMTLSQYLKHIGMQ